MPLRALWAALSLCLLVSVAFNIYQKQQIRRYLLHPNYSDLDGPFIEKAKMAWSEKNERSIADAMRDRFVKTIHLNNMVCVDLELEVGALGGSPVYCFHEASGNLIIKSDNVE